MTISMLIQGFAIIVSELHEQLKIYHNNSPKLLNLIRDADVINETLQDLPNVPDEKRRSVKKALEDLLTNLKEIRQFTSTFIEVLSRRDWSGLLVSFWNARKYDTRMDILKTNLTESFQRLANGLTISNYVLNTEIEESSKKWSYDQRDHSIMMSLNLKNFSIPEEVTEKLAFLEGEIRTISPKFVKSKIPSNHTESTEATISSSATVIETMVVNQAPAQKSDKHAKYGVTPPVTEMMTNPKGLEDLHNHLLNNNIAELLSAIEVCRITSIKKYAELALVQLQKSRTKWDELPIRIQEKILNHTKALLILAKHPNLHNFTELCKYSSSTNTVKLETIRKDIEKYSRYNHDSSEVEVGDEFTIERKSIADKIAIARQKSNYSSNIGAKNKSTELRNHGLFKITGENNYKIMRADGITALIQEAQQGEQTAMYNLGIVFEKGYTENGLPNMHLALEWYTKASEADPTDEMARQKMYMIANFIKATGESLRPEFRK
ncbi:MAG: hypothetical protein ACO1N3_02405 [Gammaproteobacteria bacterium]